MALGALVHELRLVRRLAHQCVAEAQPSLVGVEPLDQPSIEKSIEVMVERPIEGRQRPGVVQRAGEVARSAGSNSRPIVAASCAIRFDGPIASRPSLEQLGEAAGMRPPRGRRRPPA